MTDYTSGGVQAKGATHRIIVSENGIRVEPIDKPPTLQQYPSNLFRE